jgi:hypothetical protein
MLGGVCLGNNRGGDFLKSKHLEDKKKTVRVKEQLAKMMELHDVYGTLASASKVCGGH